MPLPPIYLGLKDPEIIMYVARGKKLLLDAVFVGAFVNLLKCILDLFFKIIPTVLVINEESRMGIYLLFFYEFLYCK